MDRPPKRQKYPYSQSDMAVTGADSDSAEARKIIGHYGSEGNTITGGSINEMKTVMGAHEKEYDRANPDFAEYKRRKQTEEWAEKARKRQEESDTRKRLSFQKGGTVTTRYQKGGLAREEETARRVARSGPGEPGWPKPTDKLRDAVESNANKQGLELISRDLDKPQLTRPSTDQYMREKGYPSRGDVPKEYRTGKRDAPTKSSGHPLMDALGYNKGGMVKHGSSTCVRSRTKG